jgi:hypothetical protein
MAHKEEGTAMRRLPWIGTVAPGPGLGLPPLYSCLLVPCSPVLCGSCCLAGAVPHEEPAVPVAVARSEAITSRPCGGESPPGGRHRHA